MSCTLCVCVEGPSYPSVCHEHVCLFNKALRRHSGSASLVLLNLPDPEKSVTQRGAGGGAQKYLAFIDDLTHGIDRVLLVHGTGHEYLSTLD